MKHTLCYLLGSALALSATAALADPLPADWYVGLSGDVTWLNHDNSTGGGNVAVGARLWPTDFGNFRLEGEAGYHDFSDSHYDTYMGNLYYDFMNLAPSQSAWKVTPYIGGGVGDATVHFGESNNAGRYNIHSDVFAYQFMAGLNFIPTAMPATEWAVGYRYLGSDSASANDNAGISNSERISANNVEVALRYHF